MSEERKPGGPDLTQGVLPADFAEGKLLGHVADDEVLLVQVGSEVLAIDPYCSHYHGPLAEGLVVDDTIRCSWHHACFSLRTGDATRPPALSRLSVWLVEREGDKIFVRRRLETPRAAAPRAAAAPVCVPKTLSELMT
jgi:nitrite reductase/ring-hydroxylating ferredoxin subunit